MVIRRIKREAHKVQPFGQEDALMLIRGICAFCNIQQGKMHEKAAQQYKAAADAASTAALTISYVHPDAVVSGVESMKRLGTDRETMKALMDLFMQRFGG